MVHKTKPLAFAMGAVLMIAWPLLGYLEYVHLLGFPDGHATDYGQAMRWVYAASLLPALGLGAACVYQGWKAPPERLGRRLAVVAAIVALGVVAWVIVDYSLFEHLDHGQGG